MKWFFALKQGNDFSSSYVQLLKVAVVSALKNTTLEPYFVYDGTPGALTEWMTDRGVHVIYHRSSFYPELEKIADKKQDPNYLTIGAGAFLRVDIPGLAKAHGIDDEFVLYTDVDVVFNADVVPFLKQLRPTYFAVSPEIVKDDYNNINSGVMLMNLPNLRKVDLEFKKFVTRKMNKLVRMSWDQGAYILFFKGGFFSKPKWDILPIEYNWKSYWKGDPSAAQIIHFHGPKPQNRNQLPDRASFPHLEPVFKLMTPEYFQCCESWDRLYAEIDNGPR